MRKNGFTLIELLVVIAIIAILAAILFPVFLKAKAAANMSKCLSNCKQIATGLSLYKDDHHGCWTGCYYQHPTYANRGGYDPVYRHAFWMRLLMPYVRNKNVYVCPSAPVKEGADWTRIDKRWGFDPSQTQAIAQWTATNYGINECLVEQLWADLAGVSTLMNESAIRYASKTALVAESNYVIFWGGAPPGSGGTSTGVGHDGKTYPDGMLRIKYPNHPNTGVTPVYNLSKVRHDGRTVVVFADLHVKALATDQIRIEGLNTNNVRMYPIIHPMAKPL